LSSEVISDNLWRFFEQKTEKTEENRFLLQRFLFKVLLWAFDPSDDNIHCQISFTLILPEKWVDETIQNNN
jgi:hypothetical protein